MSTMPDSLKPSSLSRSHAPTLSPTHALTLPRILQLPPEVITKIAAGEVIERPASVVKELLENSVDAGATRIDIEVEQGGIELIRVADNGCGMLPNDLPLAFASHATSKLASPDDLFRVRTMGFRGEALASIGSVARVRLQSRAAGEPAGGEITCEGTQLGPVRPWNGAPGTRMEVRHLFYNTPVRRKFLRTPATEIGHVAEAVTRLALACPALHLKLVHNDRLVFEVPASADLLERLGLFFGNDVKEKLIAVEARSGPVRLFGYLADPSCDRGNPRMQYFFVNGRWVRDRTLTHALQEAYRGLIMVGRYCVAFIFLELPPDVVDVNVHPTKAEVRFRDSHAVYHLLLATVREKLRALDLTPQLRMPASPHPFNGPRPPDEPFHAPASTDAASWTRDAGAPTWSPSAPSPDIPQVRKVIQLYNAYLIVETPEGMLVIDQHALHERIIYEQWRQRLRDGSLQSQRLLVPEPVELPAEQAACVLEHKAVLQQLGLGIEDFGGGTVLVTSYPALLSKAAPAGILRTAVEHLTNKDRPPSREHLVDDLLRLMACHSAIKAGDLLSAEEIAALVEQRHLADNTHHCPHGRPTALLFSKQELDRQFRRI